jgi:hypothetical protein
MDIFNPGSAPLTISNVRQVTAAPAYTLDPPPALPAPVPPNGHLPLNVKFQPATDGESSARFEIDSDDPSAPAYFVLASGRGVAAAGVPRVAARMNLGFGRLFKGNHRTLKLRVANAGLGDLHISAINRVSGSGDVTMSSAVALPLVLQPGDTQDLDFRFEPTDNDDRSATFEIVSDDPRSPFAVSASASSTGFSSPWLAIGLILLGAAALGGGYLAYRELVQKH